MLTLITLQKYISETTVSLQLHRYLAFIMNKALLFWTIFIPLLFESSKAVVYGLLVARGYSTDVILVPGHYA